MNKLIKLIEMEPGDRLLIVNAFFLLNLIRLGLFLLPFSRLLKVLNLYSNLRYKKVGKQLKVEQILHAVHTSNYYVLGNSKCLAKALTTQVLLRMSGYTSELKIGVAKEKEGDLQAHAWVEYQGRVIIGGLRNLDTFAPITSI